jgi:hypothetical protein
MNKSGRDSAVVVYSSCTLNHAVAEPDRNLNSIAAMATADLLIFVDAPCIDKVFSLIQKLVHGSATGPGDIPPQLLNCAVGPLYLNLQQRFLIMWSSGEYQSTIKMIIKHHTCTVQGKRS